VALFAVASGILLLLSWAFLIVSIVIGPTALFTRLS
jgi:hypothetical protein